ncbi:MAG: sensor domain-containing diguanylate cyclase [Actinomycetota bacterium]|nr:sensor domain-containing diguanylate cyclase [Actinomycetota bacterium]
MDGRARAILDAAHSAFVSMDALGRIAFWNRRAEEIFGWSAADAQGVVLCDLIIPERHRQAHRDGVSRFLLHGGSGSMLNRLVELSALRRDGNEFPIEITISAMSESEGWSFHAFIQDISEREHARRERAELLEKVEVLARTDELTGLPNRRYWEEELRRELARAGRGGHGVTVALLDLDHFKEYNDTRGHLAGDELLKTIGHAWRLALRGSDFIARYGGEEFAILLPECPPGNPQEAMARLQGCLPDRQTFSGGLAVWDGREPVEGLMGRADRALYKAKQAGRDRIEGAEREEHLRS